MTPRLAVVAIVCALAMAGCAAARYADRAPLSRAELLSGSALFGAEAASWALPAEDILALDDRMRQFLRDHVDRHGSHSHRLRTLLKAMLESGHLALQYDPQQTLTAAETFHRQTGNCLAFTNLFVALAREIGLDVRFQQVDVPPIWMRDGDAIVLNRHINAVIKNPHEHDNMVDFNRADYRGNYDAWLVADSSAFAQYYSNLGIQYLEAGNRREAFRYLKKALQLDHRQAALWVNLGALYSRHGAYRHAEAAYLYGLAEDPRDRTANNSLANLYRYLGDRSAAAEFTKRSRYYRNANPYYHGWLAQQALLRREYRVSLNHLDAALRRKGDEHWFHFLKGLNHHRLGDPERASRHFNKALERADLTQVQQQYKHKLKLLGVN